MIKKVARASKSAPSVPAPTRLTIAEAAVATGITTHTLRYYERIGLLMPVARATSGHRRYSPDDLRWVQFLARMHATGMTIRKMTEYARLVRKGDAAADERRTLLEAHRIDMKARIEELQSTLTLIERKLALYDQPAKPTTNVSLSAGRRR